MQMLKPLFFIFLLNVVHIIEASETFQVTYPIDYYNSNPVYTQLLMNYTFGNSYGAPASLNYLAPPSTTQFNKVVVTLNTSVSGSQYDRLAHLYLDGIPLWRTSTAEPGGGSVTSSFSKDLSDYTILFERNNINLLFQLDNELDSSLGLDGAFDMQLYAYYYYEAQPLATISKRDSTGDFDSIYQAYSPASQVYSIVDSTSPPLLELSNSNLQFTVPTLNANTTRAKLNIFISGNADEEFWYTNTINNFTNVFSGETLTSHGPCRMVNVYLSGEKIATVAPQPFIFTGGLDPSFWGPIVSDGAFDLKPMQIELTSVLPLIWNGGQVLEIEVTNCLEDGSGDVGSNWLTTGNILTWESDEVVSSKGQLITLGYSGGAGGYGYSQNGSLVQIVNGEYGTSSSSVLNYTLSDGTLLSVLSSFSSSARASNVQNYQNSGAYESLVGIYTSQQSYFLQDLASQSTYVTYNTSSTYPVYVDLGNGYSNVVSVVSDKTLLNNQQVAYIGSTQNATVINNFYSGNTELYKASMSSPFPSVSYERNVRAENSNVNQDSVTGYSYVAGSSGVSVGSPSLSLFADIYDHLNSIISSDLIDGDLVGEFYSSLTDIEGVVQSENLVQS